MNCNIYINFKFKSIFIKGENEMKKVLIVDDAVYMRLSLREILERNGFEVIGDAENGIEAIDKYKMLSPDIVTMDITMPEMDGVQALVEIKK